MEMWREKEKQLALPAKEKEKGGPTAAKSKEVSPTGQGKAITSAGKAVVSPIKEEQRQFQLKAVK